MSAAVRVFSSKILFQKSSSEAATMAKNSLSLMPPICTGPGKLTADFMQSIVRGEARPKDGQTVASTTKTGNSVAPGTPKFAMTALKSIALGKSASSGPSRVGV